VTLTVAITVALTVAMTAATIQFTVNYQPSTVDRQSSPSTVDNNGDG